MKNLIILSKKRRPVFNIMSVSCFVTRIGVLIKKSCLSIEQINKIKSLLHVIKIKTIKKLGRNIDIKNEADLCEEIFLSEPMLRLGRFLPFCKLGLGDYKFINKIGNGKSLPRKILSTTLKLNNNQKCVYKWLLSNIYTPEKISSGSASCILVLGTGAGKTYMGLKLIHRFAKKTLIIVPSNSVMERWKEVVGEIFPGISIGEYSSHRHKDGDIVLMIINSLSTKKTFTFGSGLSGKTIESGKYLSKFGFIIYDEIHNYSSAKFRRAFWKTNFKYRLGLTATPDMRSDDMDVIYKAHMGNLIFGNKIPGYNIDSRQNKGQTVIPIRYYGPPEYTQIIRNPKLNTIWYLKMIQQICADPYRNKFLAQKTKELIDEGRNIFIFFLERKFSSGLRKILTEIGVNFEIDEGKILIGGSKKKDLDRAKKSRVILTTYGYGWQGISYTHMDTIIFATPQKSELKQKQTMGRILGMRGDPNKDRIIVDIIDAETPLRFQWFKRKKNYDDPESDFNVTDYTDISWESLDDNAENSDEQKSENNDYSID